MIILGIDPGYAIVGYGALRFERGQYRAIGFGAITTEAGMDFFSEASVHLRQYDGNDTAVQAGCGCH